ncbi:MAG: ABC transporter ATP-binding protein [Acidobacteria bacterium]|nr:MAG: ABC transporter ATP-binding protein [Acidobacteriota bacterium]
MIHVSDLTKTFRIYPRPIDRIWETVSFSRRRRHTLFTAVDHVTFDVAKGQTLALLGQNGSGKSTMLKILAGLMRPTSGDFQVQGRIASLIELGTGFHPEFSGRANVQLVASLMGFSKGEIPELLEIVVDFSGLGEFIDRPLKTYSSGMWVRLGFSIAVSVDPDVLLIDEALSVGDLLFQQKCIARLREFQKRATTMVFVSHDLNAIKNLCDRALLLDRGKMLDDGVPEAVCSHYVSLLADRANNEKLETRASAAHRRYGSYRAEILSVALLDAQDQPKEVLISGERAVLQVKVKVSAGLVEPSVGILIRDRYGNDIFGTNTFLNGIRLDAEARELSVAFEADFELGAGAYYVTAAVHSGRDHMSECYDWIDNALAFRVLHGEFPFAGCARLKPKITVRRVEPAEPARSAAPPK